MTSVMDRRAFVSGITLALLAAPLVAEGQQAGKIPRIGFLGGTSSPSTVEAFRQGLRDSGYVEGQNIVIEYRWTEGKPERFTDFAAEMVRLKVDVIVTGVDRATRAAQRATRTIPIVMALATDPVGLGFVANLARPGGNITGLSIQSAELPGKRLQLLREAVPRATQVTVLWDPTEPGRRDTVREADSAGRRLGMQLRSREVPSPSELDRAFAAMVREGAHAVLLTESPKFGAHRSQIADLTVKHHLPTMCVEPRYVEAGCLMSYGASFTDLNRRAAYVVAKILNGAKPADLPVEQPSTFELIINLKTAKALGLTIPPSLLQRADLVIE